MVIPDRLQLKTPVASLPFDGRSRSRVSTKRKDPCRPPFAPLRGKLARPATSPERHDANGHGRVAAGLRSCEWPRGVLRDGRPPLAGGGHRQPTRAPWSSLEGALRTPEVSYCASLDMTKWLVSCSLGVGIVVQVTCAVAQATTDMDSARALFDDARLLMKTARYDEACPKLEAVKEIYAGPG